MLFLGRNPAARSATVGRTWYWWPKIPGWWFGTCIGNFIIPTDEHIFQRGRYTTNQILWQFSRIGPFVPVGCWVPKQLSAKLRLMDIDGALGAQHTIIYHAFESIKKLLQWGWNHLLTKRYRYFPNMELEEPPLNHRLHQGSRLPVWNSALRLLLKSGCQCRTGHFFGVASYRQDGTTIPLKFLQ